MHLCLLINYNKLGGVVAWWRTEVRGQRTQSRQFICSGSSENSGQKVAAMGSGWRASAPLARHSIQHRCDGMPLTGCSTCGDRSTWTESREDHFRCRRVAPCCFVPYTSRNQVWFLLCPHHVCPYYVASATCRLSKRSFRAQDLECAFADACLTWPAAPLWSDGCRAACHETGW